MRRALTVLLVLFVGTFIASTAAAQPVKRVEYYHLDALGSVRAVTDQQGHEIERHDYLPFGEEWPQPTFRSTRLFTGKEHDFESAFDYFGARYYPATHGRFTTADPSGDVDARLTDPQQWNGYTYVRNNLHRYVDPDGRDLLLSYRFLSQETYERNATIRSAVATVMSVTPETAPFGRLFAGGVADAVLGMLLPVDQQEEGRNVINAVIGIASPMQVGGATAFSSFRAFKSFSGEAGVGHQWHHIVEQSQSQFGPKAINSTENILRLPADVHLRVSAFYSSKQPFTGGLTVRQWLRTLSWKEQYSFGLDVIKRELAK